MKPRVWPRVLGWRGPLHSAIAFGSIAVWGMVLLAAIQAGPVASAEQAQGSPGAREDMSDYLPPGTGKDLVARECSACHDLEGVVRFRATREGWEALVLDMAARGAPLMVEDVDVITAYLGEVFGPQAPPLVDVNTATPGELAKIPGVTPVVASKVVERRQQKGPFASRDELKAALGLDDRAFDKVKWYLRAEPSERGEPK